MPRISPATKIPWLQMQPITVGAVDPSNGLQESQIILWRPVSWSDLEGWTPPDTIFFRMSFWRFLEGRISSGKRLMIQKCQQKWWSSTGPQPGFSNIHCPVLPPRRRFRIFEYCCTRSKFGRASEACPEMIRHRPAR